MPQRLGAILAVAFGVSLSVIDGTVANVALPTIGQLSGTDAAVVAVTDIEKGASGVQEGKSENEWRPF